MEDELGIEMGERLASADFVTWLFPTEVRETFFFLNELEDGNMDDGLTIPGVMEEPFIMAAWLVKPLDREAQKAHDDLLSWGACQFNITPEEIYALKQSRLSALLLT